MNRLLQLTFISPKEITRIKQGISEPIQRASLLSDLFRLNTLSMIEEAGSGHIGSSFSCMEILTWLWMEELRYPNEMDKTDADILFSSKGHDVPALYSVLIGTGRIKYELIHTLRKLHGLPGHPDVSIPYIATNTGPLGMGISKARGFALANRLNKRNGRIFVLTGDGELEEGQIWESLSATANEGFGEIIVIVDHNKIQSDTWIKKVNDLGDLESKFKSFGWAVSRCDGHDIGAIRRELTFLEKTYPKQPKVLIADTVKGKGVSFMEKLEKKDGIELYAFHSGAPSVEAYESAVAEITKRISEKIKKYGLSNIRYDYVAMEPRIVVADKERLVVAYGEELVALGRVDQDIMVLDADLMVDCGLSPFKQEFPGRFVECGIAEQDMVSVAGGLALKKKIPIVHSFACFLSTRANEQIYNNASERTKIIYTGSLAGVLPATPGHSHQSVRDISTIGSIPGITMFEPCNEAETRMAIRWAVEKNRFSTYLRLVSVPCKIPYSLPAGYSLRKGIGVELFPGKDVVLFAYGPIMLTEAVKAREELMKKGIKVAVVNYPWLNVIDLTWLRKVLLGKKLVVTIDDHYIRFGAGEMIAAEIARLRIPCPVLSLGLTDIPECGQPDEVLTFHHLDGLSIAQSVKKAYREKRRNNTPR